MNKIKNSIQRFMFKQTAIRGEIIHLTDVYQTIANQHAYPLAVQKILGESLMVSGLLMATIKHDGKLTVQFQGKNPFKMLLTQCNHEFEMRGLAQWEGEVSEADIQAALKNGTIVITITSNQTNATHQGMVSWQADTLSENMENYFRDSEQIPTRLWLAVNDQTAVGLLLQKMPGDQHATPDEDDWGRITTLADTLTNEELLSLDSETLLYRLFNEEVVELYEKKPVTFKCACSAERCKKTLSLLAIEEVEAELKLNQQLVVTCEFCNTDYIFTRADVMDILKRGRGSPGKTLH